LSTVDVLIDGSSIGTATADASGNWMYDHTEISLTEGNYSVTATSTDPAGNTSAVSTAFAFTVDLTAPDAPTLQLASSTDLGISNSDNLTSGDSFVFQGTAEVGSFVTIALQGFGGPSDPIEVDESGNWSFTLENEFASGTYPFVATATDLAGNASELSTVLNLINDQDLSFSTISPAQGEIDVLPNANLTITFDKNVAKGSGNITIKQVGDDRVHETIDVTGSNVTINGAVVTIDPMNNILPPDTEFYVSIEAGVFENEAGYPFAGITDKTTWGFTIIAASVVSSVEVRRNKTYKIGDVIDFRVNMDLPVSITGTATLPLTIGTTTVNATQVGTVSNSSDISFSYTVLEGQEDTDGIVIGSAMNLNGGTMKDAFDVDAILTLNNITSTAEVLVDGIKPAAPSILSLDSDTGSSDTDRITNDSQLSFLGTAEALSTVEVLIDGSSIGTATADASGNWMYDHTEISLTEGNYSVTATSTDVAGNTSAVSTAFAFTLDLTAPLAPTVGLSAGSDYGQSNSDNITYYEETNSLFIGGTTEANAKLELTLSYNGTTSFSLPAQADASGNWSFDLNGISWKFSDGLSGDLSIEVFAIDVAGNSGKVINVARATITIDQKLEATFAPADDEIDVLPNANLTMDFSEPVFKGSGTIEIRQSSDDSIVETIDIGSESVLISGNVVTVSPGGILPPDTEIYLSITAGSFTDIGGYPFAGISDKTTWSFTIIAASVVTSVEVPTNKTYKIGDVLDFKVNMVLPVSITGTASIPVTIGSTEVNATQVGTVSNASVITFSYTVLEGQEDTDGIVIGSAMNLNGGTMKDAFDVDAILTLNNIASTAEVLVDGIKPAAPLISNITNDSGTSATDGITNDNQLSFSGTAEALSTIDVLIDGSSIGTLTADASGNWVYDHTATSLSDATYSVTATSTDAAGNTSAISTAFALTVDTTAPDSPIVDLSSISDTGISDTDNLTSNVNIALEGTAEAGTALELFLDGMSIGSLVVDGSGNWNFDTETIQPEGTYTYTALTTDIAGNTSTTSTDLNVEVNRTLEVASLSPANMSMDILVKANLVITFAEDVFKGAGSLQIREMSNDEVVEEIAISGDNVVVSGASITINPVNLIAPAASSFYITIDQGGFTDNAGFAFDGISTSGVWSFTTLGDSDQDGVFDLEENLNGDGELDNDDTDGDGIPDYLDPDDDGDGVLTMNEDLDGNGDLFNEDTDGDGVPNFRDEDDDGDGILTKNEDFNRDGDLTNDDNDNDGIPDYLDNAIIPDEENIPQGLSPDGDGANDTWRLPEIESYPNNRVTIFNRWGKIVFEITGYDNTSKVFTGQSNSGALPGADMLPDGTYFYVIDYGNETVRKGYIIIKQ